MDTIVAIMILAGTLIGIIAGVVITNIEKANLIKRIQTIIDEASASQAKYGPLAAQLMSSLSYEDRTKLYHLSDKLNAVLREAGLNTKGLL